MPVVHLRSLAIDAGAADSALPAIAAAVAAAAPCEPDDVWCTFQLLQSQTIGELGIAGTSRIAYVDVWMRPRPEDERACLRALEAACRAAATVLGIPVEDVWGALHPVEPGRVFAGGALLD